MPPEHTMRKPGPVPGCNNPPAPHSPCPGTFCCCMFQHATPRLQSILNHPFYMDLYYCKALCPAEHYRGITWPQVSLHLTTAWRSCVLKGADGCLRHSEITPAQWHSIAMHWFAHQGSLILHFTFLAKPSHPLSFKVKHPFPFTSKRFLVPCSIPGHLSQENRSWPVLLGHSIAWRAEKQTHCTFESSNLSSTWQPLVQRSLKPFKHSYLPRASWKSFPTLLSFALLWGIGKPL